MWGDGGGGGGGRVWSQARCCCYCWHLQQTLAQPFTLYNKCRDEDVVPERDEERAVREVAGGGDFFLLLLLYRSFSFFTRAGWRGGMVGRGRARGGYQGGNGEERPQRAPSFLLFLPPLPTSAFLRPLSACTASHGDASHAPPPSHRRAEELLKRLCAVDSPRPAVDLEDAAIVARLMRLFHGNAEGAAVEEGVPEADRQQAASMPGEGGG